MATVLAKPDASAKTDSCGVHNHDCGKYLFLADGDAVFPNFTAFSDAFRHASGGNIAKAGK
jgi:hypothetical protein